MLHSELVLKETDASEAYPRVAQEDITSLDAVILAKDQARVGITDAALAAMDTRIDELTDLRNKRSVALDSLRQACITLWCKLDISSSHQQEFLLASQGVSRRTMAKVRLVMFHVTSMQTHLSSCSTLTKSIDCTNCESSEFLL